LLAKPEPKPPKAYAERTMTGKPIFFAAVTASSTVSTAVEVATGMLISLKALANKSRSSDNCKV
jgi:hypothetical protein